MQKNNLAIILSGGTGKRFDISKPKQFYELNKKKIIEISVEKFINSNLFNHIIIVSHKNFLRFTQKLFNYKNVKVVTGGENRQESVFKGLSAAKSLKPKFVFIHDAVRPFFSMNFFNLAAFTTIFFSDFTIQELLIGETILYPLYSTRVCLSFTDCFYLFLFVFILA